MPCITAMMWVTYTPSLPGNVSIRQPLQTMADLLTLSDLIKAPFPTTQSYSRTQWKVSPGSSLALSQYRPGRRSWRIMGMLIGADAATPAPAATLFHAVELDQRSQQLAKHSPLIRLEMDQDTAVPQRGFTSSVQRLHTLTVESTQLFRLDKRESGFYRAT